MPCLRHSLLFRTIAANEKQHTGWCVKAPKEWFAMSRKILFISDNFPPVIGGSATVYDQVCRHNSDAIIALSSKRNFMDGSEKDFSGYDNSCGFKIFRIRHLRGARRPSTAKSSLFGSLLDVAVILKLSIWIAWLCMRYRIKTICIGELVYLGWISFFARYALGIPSVIYCHGEEITQDGSGFFTERRGSFLRRCSRIIAVSHFCKSEIVSRFGVLPDKIQVVTNGVDIHRFWPAEPEIGLLRRYRLDGKKVIVAAGRHVPRKGFDNLLRATPAILRAHPSAHLLLLGDGPQTDELKQIVANIGIQEHVTFAGFVGLASVPDHYRLGQLFVMPNRTMGDGDQEGFGLVFVEANACGLPAIGGVSGGAIEAIIDGETGILVDGTKVGAIAEAVSTMLGDQDQRQRLAKQGLERARKMAWPDKAREFRGAALFTDKVTELPFGKTAHAERLVPTELNERPRLLVTVDLEETFDWDALPYVAGEVRGLEEVREFQAVCEDLGVRPTYFATYPIMQDPHFSAFLVGLQAGGRGEVGIHVHSWSTPPAYETKNVYNSYQGNLPVHLEQAKLRNFVSTYNEIFGAPPRAHRAGRYGLGPHTYALLADCGILVDSSISACFDFSPTGGPNFRSDPGYTKWVGPRKTILSLPIAGSRFLRGPLWLSRFGRAPVMDSFLGRSVRLSPEDTELSWMKMVAAEKLAAGQRDIVVSLHSTSLVQGGNPYSSGSKDIEAVVGRLSAFVRWMIEAHNAQPLTASEAYSDHLRARTRL